MNHRSLVMSALLVLSSPAIAMPIVSNNIISWPDDGWYQVQDANNYAHICEGGLSCEVETGTYIVINHTNGQRYENIVVGPSSDPTSPIVVTGNTISWPNDGWYQVQDANNYAEVCHGGLSCELPSGTYIVINHTTGQRFPGITVSSDQETGPDSTSLVELVSFTYESRAALNHSDSTLPQGTAYGSFRQALSEDGRFAYFYTDNSDIDQNTGNTQSELLYRYDSELQSNTALSDVASPEQFQMGSDAQSGLYFDSSGELNFYNAASGNVILNDLVPGSAYIRKAILSRDGSTVAFIRAAGSLYEGHVYNTIDGSVQTVSQQVTPFKEHADSEYDWTVDNVMSISDNGNIVVFSGNFLPFPDGLPTNLAQAATQLVFNRDENTIDLVGQYVRSFYGSSPTYETSFNAVTSGDGQRVIYNALPESRWGEIAYSKQGYSYNVSTGVTTELTDLVNASDISASADLNHLVYRLNSSIVLYFTDTQDSRILSTQGWSHCYITCLDGQSNYYKPGISDDGSTVLFFESVADGDVRYQSPLVTQLMIHDVDTNTTMPLVDVIGDMNSKMPLVDNNAFESFDLSADGQKILVTAERNIATDSATSVANTYLIDRSAH